MKTILKTIFIVTFLTASFAANSSEKLYKKIGIFDYKHETGALAYNIKKVTDNNYNVFYLGELTQVYEFMGFWDKNDFFWKGEERKRIDEYGIYLSSGLQKNINFLKNITLVPSFSVGFYQEFDDGKDMGLPIEFKSELEFNYHLSDKSEIGFTWNHISNADIGDNNPGSDSFFFGYRVKENF